MSVIRDAYDLIKDRQNWMQGDYTDGRRLCASGAVLYVSGGMLERSMNTPTNFRLIGRFPPELDRLHQLACSMYDISIGVAPLIWVNDTLGHEAVLAVFEKALAEDGELL